LSIKERA